MSQEATFIMLASALIEKARDEQKMACGPQAAREFALTITALEDAAMRFNRGIALKNGLNHSLLGEDAEAVIDAESAEAIAEANDPPDGSYGKQMDVNEVIELAKQADAATQAATPPDEYAPAAV